MVAWVVLAEALGVELILGAFLAGVIAGLLDDQEGENAVRSSMLSVMDSSSLSSS